VQRVFAALADGAAHSGEQLAAGQAVSRSAIWKAVGALQELGLTIEAAPHRGYRLRGPVTPLEATRIVSELSPSVSERLRSAEVAWSLPRRTARCWRAPSHRSASLISCWPNTRVPGAAGVRGNGSRPGGALCLRSAGYAASRAAPRP
jgi:biotin operon repressor BirA-like protein